MGGVEMTESKEKMKNDPQRNPSRSKDFPARGGLLIAPDFYLQTNISCYVLASS